MDRNVLIKLNYIKLSIFELHRYGGSYEFSILENALFSSVNFREVLLLYLFVVEMILVKLSFTHYSVYYYAVLL